jgi:hypothetical protein
MMRRMSKTLLLLATGISGLPAKHCAARLA